MTEKMQNANPYFDLQFREGVNVIKFWLECRYKILQFTGYFNAAILTFGFGQEVLLTSERAVAGALVSFLAVLVAGMGLATEYSNSTYLSAYFNTLKDIESKVGAGLEKKGIFTHGADEIALNKMHAVFPVHRAHKLFYFALIVLWCGMLVYHLTLII